MATNGNERPTSIKRAKDPSQEEEAKEPSTIEEAKAKAKEEAIISAKRLLAKAQAMRFTTQEVEWTCFIKKPATKSHKENPSSIGGGVPEENRQSSESQISDRANGKSTS